LLGSGGEFQVLLHKEPETGSPMIASLKER
jgi:hypothetical protein